MLTAQSYVTNEQRQQQRRQKAKAPLVDSSLLRFLSAQKTSGAAVILKDDKRQTSYTENPSKSISASSNGVVGGRVEVDLPTFTAEISVAEAEAPQTSTTPTSSSQAIDISPSQPIENQSWLSQYNFQRVALKLQALGVDSEAAIAAGKVVQGYALARVTRRRIRRYLQERDALWESGGYSSIPIDRKGMKESISTVAASNFDVDEVIGVMTEHGLTGIDIAAIFSHTPSVAMMKARKELDAFTVGERGESFSLEETLDRVFMRLLGETLKLRRYDARKVLRASAGLLTSKGSASAVQVVELMASLGSSTNALARDKASLPNLLCRSPPLIFRLVAFLSSAQLRVPLSAIGPILRQKQSAQLLNAVAPRKRPLTVDAYDDNTPLNTDSGILGYFNVDNTLRQQKIDENYRTMEAMADVLRRSAGIKDFRKILSSYPQLFFLNVSNVHSIIHFLREEVSMTKDDISKVIQTFPILLEKDPTHMQGVVDFLLSIEIEQDDLPSILRSFPSILLLDVETNMIPVVSFLNDVGVRNTGRFVTRLPPVLGYSVENDLKPKWNFLREVCQFDYFEVVRFPAYFSYPLERVIKMRYEYLRDCKGIPIQLARVDDVLRFGDRDFATEIALDNDDGVAFAKFVEERSSARSRRKIASKTT
jgi:hypothetical protein